MEMTKKEEKKSEYETMLQCRIRDLTREKENLSELNRKQSKAFKETMKDYRELLRDYMRIGEENKKLKSDLAYERTLLDNVRAEYESLQNVIKELKGKVETLELWLDNKEKLNEEYRNEIDKYKIQYEHSMGEDDELIYEEGLYD